MASDRAAIAYGIGLFALVAFVAVGGVGWAYDGLAWTWGGHGWGGGSATGYLISSGPFPDLTMLGLFGVWWRKHNCMVHGCPRLQWHPHPDHGHVVCRHHHPCHGKVAG